MKKDNGMSHITLIIWVLIILAIGALAISFITKDINNRKIENLTTDMLLVQGKIKVIAQENEMNEEEHHLIGRKVQDNLEDEKVKKLLENNIIKSEDEIFDKYYIIDSEILKELNLQDNLDGEYYIVNYTSYEIIYTKGLEIDGQMHYTLTELLEHRNKKEQNIQVTNEEQINVEQN